ncbi:MAG: bifunctional heptose 7-phosphate kinase/heptose 1-phosphate adenyltransferase, partial [Acidobacteriota bacterium]
MKKLLTDRVDRFAGTKVAVWCDLVLDEFLYGRISRISREAPVLILDYDHRSTMPGGGANAIENLRALGAVPLPVGVIGRDDAGDRLMAWMEASGIDTTGVARVPDYTTPSKSRVLAGLPHCRPQQILRIDRGAPRELPVDAAVERLRAILSGEEVRALLISDYGYGIITPESAGPILAEARRLGIPAACDSRHRLKRFQGVTAATPNLEEAEEILGERLGDDPSRIVDAGRRLV